MSPPGPLAKGKKQGAVTLASGRPFPLVPRVSRALHVCPQLPPSLPPSLRLRKAHPPVAQLPQLLAPSIWLSCSHNSRLMQRPRHRKTSRIESDMSWAHGSQAGDLRTLLAGAPPRWGPRVARVSALQLHLPAWCRVLERAVGNPEGEHSTPAPPPPAPLHHVSISCPLLLRLITSLTRLPEAAAHPAELTLYSMAGAGGLSRGRGLSPAEGVCSSTWLSWEFLSTILKPPISPGSPVYLHLTP